jgi:hypothetical protein
LRAPAFVMAGDPTTLQADGWWSGPTKGRLFTGYGLMGRSFRLGGFRMGKLRLRAAAYLVEVVPQQLAYDEEMLLVVEVLVELHRTAVAARPVPCAALPFP